MRVTQEYGRAGVRCEPSGRPLLIRPRESVLRVLRELYVIGRIGIDEITTGQRDCFHVNIRERPARKDVSVLREVLRIADSCVSPERYVEFSRPIEAAEPVKT